MHHLNNNNPFLNFFGIFLPKDTVEDATQALGRRAVNRVIKMPLLLSVCHFSARTPDTDAVFACGLYSMRGVHI